MVKGNQRSDAKHALDEPLLPNKQSRYTESLSSVSDDFLSEDEEEESTFYSEDLLPKLSDKAVVSMFGVALLVTGGLATSTLALILVQSVTVILMGAICLANSLVVARNHFRVENSEGVRASVETIRKEMDILKDEIDFLNHSVDDLQAEADVMKGFERELREIAMTEGERVKDIIDLVNENEQILNQMKSNLRKMFVAAMTTVIVRADKDGSMKIDVEEIPFLGLRLQRKLNPYGIKLDMNKFEAMIREDNDICSVLRFCGEMLFEEGSNENEDDNDSVNSDLTSFDFERQFEKAYASNKMSYEEKASMAIIDVDFGKGSVEVARSRRMTLLPTKSKKELRKRAIVTEVKNRQTKLVARLKESNRVRVYAASKLGRRVTVPTAALGRRGTVATFTSSHVWVRGSSAEF